MNLSKNGKRFLIRASNLENKIKASLYTIRLLILLHLFLFSAFLTLYFSKLSARISDFFSYHSQKKRLDQKY